MTLADNSKWRYHNDALGQVTGGKRYWSDDTAVGGQQYEYGFDDIGNRTTVASGGDQNGGSLRAAAYSAANAVNQYPGRNVPGAMDVVGEANASARVLVNFQPVNRHGEYYLVWGLDLSGSMQGAGGVGGLLTIRDHVTGVNYAVMRDGNGNVVGLVDSNGGYVAKYECGPFGELIRATGPMAKGNPFRFSNKFTDDETDLVYFSHRYYGPSMGGAK